MSLTSRPTRTAAPFSGGANGLPTATFGERLFPLAGGSFMAQQAASVAATQDRSLASLGVVMTPGMTFAEAISLASNQKGASGRIFVGEGVWDVGAAGVNVSTEGLEIVSLSPGRTFFRRTTASATPLVNVLATGFRIQGVTFLCTGTLSAAIEVRSTNAIIDDCRFTLGVGVTTAGTSSGLCVRNCEWGTAANAAAITITGTCYEPQIIGNRFRNLNAVVYFATNAAIGGLIVGNSFASGGAITVPAGFGTVVVGNNVDGGASSYTLTDNTVLGTIMAWPIGATYGASLDFSLYRGATPDITTGRLDLVMNSAECLVSMYAVTTTVDPGVTFIGTIVGSNAELQYTTTATGNDATLKITKIQERNY